MWVLERLVQFFLLVRRASACRHRHAYRERRKLNGVFVMHFVCERCGQAMPVIDRTAREHRQAVAIGGRPNTRVLRPPALVVSMESRPRKKAVVAASGR